MIMLMNKVQSKKSKIYRHCLLNILINKYKREGFIVETELKTIGNFQYFEMRKYTKIDAFSKKILNGKVYFEVSGEDFLSEYYQTRYNLNRQTINQY